MKEVRIPDLGGASSVDVIEVLVQPGAQVNKEDSLITLESEKASMDVPSPYAGKVKDIHIKVGDKAAEGDLILTLDVQKGEADTQQEKSANKAAPEQAEQVQKPESFLSQAKAATSTEVRVPDLGGAANVEVIEILVEPGTKINKDDSLITLESEKASMDVPSPYEGEVENIQVSVGDKVSEGSVILTLKTSRAEPVKEAMPEQAAAKSSADLGKTEAKLTALEEEKATMPPAVTEKETVKPLSMGLEVHAGPGVRRIAHEFGVDLKQVNATGPKGRILKEDIQKYVKNTLSAQGPAAVGTGLSVVPAPQVDFAKFGETETKSLSKIKKLTGQNTHRSWVTIPHVTQFDEADITEMEDFRNAKKAEAEKLGFKLTPLVFLMKAVVRCLQSFPTFNASLDGSGENLILKKYFHIGVAVDTPNGLVVPVIRDVDKKSLYDLAKELKDISEKARSKGLSLNEMQGSCFTISSLGGISGTAFTPIINAPDVAILGVSKAQMKAVYQHGAFVPRLMLPLSLSYDHRVIDGAEAARFTGFLARLLTDIRELLL